MRALLFLLGLLAAVPAQAQSKLLQAHAAASSFQGPIDIVASPTVLYSLRAGSAAIAAAGTQTLVNIRRASDNVACDFLPALTGGFGITTSTCNSSTQGGVSYGTFVGADATASCTIAGTAVACTGASATLHVNDPITGVGITNPCVVTVTNGSTTATASLAGTATSCGTVSVAETVTFQVAAFAPKIYDQTGGGHDAVQATAGNQPQFLPSCFGSKPCLLWLAGTNTNFASSAFTTVAQPYTFSDVSERVATFTGFNTVFATGPAGFGGAPNTQSGYSSSANTAYGGNVAITATATDSVAHAIQIVFNGASSTLNVDGTATPGTMVAIASGTTAYIGVYSGGGASLTGYGGEWMLYPVGFNSTQQGNMHTNQSAFYGTP